MIDRKKITIEVSETQRRFLDYCKYINYGRLEVELKEGEPIIGVSVKRSVRFDLPNIDMEIKGKP